MEPVFIENQHFIKTDYTETSLPTGEYEACTFTACNFSAADLSHSSFTNCTFTNCNVSLAKLINTAFRDVTFIGCKMLGLHFQDCSPFLLAFSFHQCNLTHTSFYKAKIKKTVFRHCQLHEVDFTECDLTSAILENCDFLNSTFDNTTLEKADLRTSVHYSIDPERNRIKKAKFSLSASSGLLDKYDIDIDSTQ